MNNPLRLLLADDSPGGAVEIVRELRGSFADLYLQHVGNTSDLVDALAHGNNWDLVITTPRLGWADGLWVLKRVKAAASNCPVIMLADSGEEEVVDKAIRAGLDYYILHARAHLGRLSAAVHSALNQRRQQQALKDAESRYQSLFNATLIG